MRTDRNTSIFPGPIPWSDVCEGRISQLRRELAESWKAFTGEPDDNTAA